MLIVVSFIISIDSFLISCLTAGKLKSNLVLILCSPLLHAMCCLLGILLQYGTLSFYNSHLLLYILSTILICSGLYLFIVYKPGKNITHKPQSILPVSLIVIILLLMFCSFDAIIAGIIFAYVNKLILESLFYIYIINLLVVLSPVIFKLFQQRAL
jgi:putative Mn2+ efflux pump MntP